MARARASMAFLCVVATAACGGGEESRSPTAAIETEDGRVEVTIEIADTAAERERGLMGRTSLPRDAGMLFVYDRDTTGGFWMKNTKIPLSIAFYDAEGRIVRILDMEPCRADPCPIYDPGVPYRGALEVNEGAFARWGVEEGDRIEIDAG